MSIIRPGAQYPPFGPRPERIGPAAEEITDPIETIRCACGSRYTGRNPDPVIFGSWLASHVRCEDGAA